MGFSDDENRIQLVTYKHKKYFAKFPGVGVDNLGTYTVGYVSVKSLISTEHSPLITY